jgi:hypothetical protein
MLRNRRDGLFIITCLVANIFDVADFPNILKNIFVELFISCYSRGVSQFEPRLGISDFKL